MATAEANQGLRCSGGPVVGTSVPQLVNMAIETGDCPTPCDDDKVQCPQSKIIIQFSRSITSAYMGACFAVTVWNIMRVVKTHHHHVWLYHRRPLFPPVLCTRTHPKVAWMYQKSSAHVWPRMTAKSSWPPTPQVGLHLPLANGMCANPHPRIRWPGCGHPQLVFKRGLEFLSSGRVAAHSSCVSSSAQAGTSAFNFFQFAYALTLRGLSRTVFWDPSHMISFWAARPTPNASLGIGQQGLDPQVTGSRAWMPRTW